MLLKKYILIFLLIVPAYFYAMEVGSESIIKLENAYTPENKKSDDEIIEEWSILTTQFFKTKFIDYKDFKKKEGLLFEAFDSFSKKCSTPEISNKMWSNYNDVFILWKNELFLQTSFCVEKAIRQLNELKTLTPEKLSVSVKDFFELNPNYLPKTMESIIVKNPSLLQHQNSDDMKKLQDRIAALENVIFDNIRNKVDQIFKQSPDLLKVDLSKIILEVFTKNPDLLEFEVAPNRLKKAEDKIGNLERIVYVQTTIIVILICICGFYNQYYTTQGL